MKIDFKVHNMLFLSMFSTILNLLAWLAAALLVSHIVLVAQFSAKILLHLKELGLLELY